MIEKIGNYTVDLDDLDFNNGEIFRRYKDRFIVSNYARCYDMETQRFLKDYCPKKSDYLIWYFSDFDDEHPVSKPIHQVVAETFCDKLDVNERLVVDHIDGDKHNNMASNLRYITYKENSNAQDVQKRKKESQAKTLKYKKNIEVLTNIIASKDEEISLLKEQIKELNNELDEEKKRPNLAADIMKMSRDADVKLLKEQIKELKNELNDEKELFNDFWGLPSEMYKKIKNAIKPIINKNDDDNQSNVSSKERNELAKEIFKMSQEKKKTA